MTEPIVASFPGPDELAARAAEIICESALEAIARQGRFTLALAGGSTPEKTYLLLSAPAMRERIDWSRTLLFLGDERFVPLDDPRSNFAMIRRSLLDHLPTQCKVFPVPTELPTPAAAAAAYATTLATAFSLTPSGEPPVFDLILLGLGDDGHTASLFPGRSALTEQHAWVIDSPPGVLPPPVDRVTFTFPILNRACKVLFLVAGTNKAEPLSDVLTGKADVNHRPAAGVRLNEGSLIWLVDQAAASRLSR